MADNYDLQRKYLNYLLRFAFFTKLIFILIGFYTTLFINTSNPTEIREEERPEEETKALFYDALKHIEVLFFTVF